MPTKERQTRQRQAIRDAIADAGVPLSPREILDQAKAHVDGLGLATVYRTLKLLADAGIVIPVEIPGQSPRFELAGKHHHHHFHCRQCGKVYEVEGCCGHFEEHAPAGFEIEGHEVLLFGRCAVCVGGKAPPDRAGAKKSRGKPGHDHHHH
ncbi:Zinc-specific metallo-regulatory protein [Phycisphaerales bacterium]|nr:Zinc-specific metallo-regulatory protein [Phycisphaerales bacterium]